MKQRKVRNRLFQLIHEREGIVGSRITQRDIAQFVGVSEHTIMAWLKNDVTRFDAKLIEHICDYFNCEIGDLLYFEWVEVEDESYPSSHA